MSDPVDALSVLGADLTNTDTAFPVLEAGIVDCTVSDMKVEPQKAPKTGHNLHITLKTTIATKTREGLTKPPGFPLRDLIGLAPTDKYDPKQRLAQFREAVMGDKTGSFNPIEQYIGKTVSVRIKVEASEQFGDQNRVAAYVKRTAS